MNIFNAIGSIVNGLIPTMFVLFHMTNAYSNASKDNSWKWAGYDDLEKRDYWIRRFHISQVLSFVILFFSLVISFLTKETFHPGWLFLIFCLTRVVFDYTHNITRGLSLDHRGIGNIEDWILTKMQMPESAFIMFRIICLILAYHFTFRYL